MFTSEPFSVNLSRAYNCSSNKLHDLFFDNSIFKLTGADEISSDYTNGNSFRLVFSGRGEIFGSLIKNEAHHLIFDWNVTGFEKPNEINTVLNLNFIESNSGVTLTLEHTNIKNKGAAEAKLKAWATILNEIDKLI